MEVEENNSSKWKKKVYQKVKGVLFNRLNKTGFRIFYLVFMYESITFE